MQNLSNLIFFVLDTAQSLMNVYIYHFLHCLCRTWIIFFSVLDMMQII